MISQRDAVEDILGAYEPEAEEVIDTATAETALRRIRRIEWQRDQDTRPYVREIERLGALLSEREQVHNRAVDFHANALERWHRAHRAEGLVPKTFKAAHGESKLVASTVAVDKTNELEFIEWAFENSPDLLNITVNVVAVRQACSNLMRAELDPDKGTLPKVIQAISDDGEVLPGLMLRRDQPTHKFHVPKVDIDG